MRWWMLAGAAALALVGIMAAGLDRRDAAVAAANADPVARGRYLVEIAGCNDCHTPAYMVKGGAVPEDQWLIGDSIGFSGPWGTTYPANLRAYMRRISEDDWVALAQTLETRPPMPWFGVRAMSEADLRAIYRYVRSLPDNDVPAPDYVPPGQEPRTPYFVFVPQQPK